MRVNGSACKCCACGEEFASEFSFDKHRVERRCLSNYEMRSRGMAQNAQGRWTSKTRDPSTLKDNV